MNKIKLLILFFALFTFSSYAQVGKVIGKVYDGSSGSPLPDAVLRIASVPKGTTSDLDGNFAFENIETGEHTVTASYIGYVPQSINVKVKQGEVVNVSLILKPEGTMTDTLLIEAERIQNNEAALLLQQQKAENIQDGISSQQIKRTADATSSDVLKRVVGVSIVDNKFVFVRGTNERYSSTTLNGVILPSTDPDKKAFSFDLFPSNLLENIVISKSYTPDQIGNFSGGLVQVTTKEFPDKFSLNFSTSGSYNSSTTGEDFLTYNAGETRILFFNSGRDDGTRELPNIIPNAPVISSNFSRQQLKTFSRAFVNNWSQEEKSAPVNGGFQLSIGNNLTIGKTSNFGFFGAYTYNNGFSTKQTERQTFTTDNQIDSKYKGTQSEYSVLWGGLLNLSFRAGENNKFSFKNTYVLSSEDETEYQEGFYTVQTQDRKLYSTKFIERDMLSSQLSGEHFISRLGKLRISWKGSYSESDRNEPDYKTIRYQREIGTDMPFFASISTVPNSAGGGRFFSTLKDIIRSLETNFELSFRPVKKIEVKSKFGVFYNRSTRDFTARLFAPILADPNSYQLTFLSIDSLFLPENIDTNKFLYDEITRPSDTYAGIDNLAAGYLMFDIPLGKLRTVIGARLESNLNKLNSIDQIGNPVNRSVNKNDILPSVNLTYALSDKMNLRASYYQSISRPEFREIAPFSFFDFQELIFNIGNPELERNIIRNYDLRYEFFPNAGEIISLSAFYKKFDSPIEEVFLPNSGGDNRIKSYMNAKSGANNYGVEIEARKNLGFINKFLKYFSVNTNISFINSKVDLSGLGSTVTSLERRLQGQSPYTINAGLYYDNYDIGTSVNLSYNRFGKRISEVGLEGISDIEENGRDVVDLTLIQRLFKNFEVKFSIKDIIAQDYLFTQVIEGKEEIYKRYNAGTGYSISLSFKY
ncbi:MAG: TonB-dependent receptor [Chlorobi bacterium]|nr:TonB-dependent receptor [Chlorobiota bacterium]MCI0716336.1 TonB-dependent receptor [Chlorobiota bacterium]